MHGNICSTAEHGSTESGSADVLSSLRCCYITECEVTGGHLSTSGGVSWGRGYSRSHPFEAWSTGDSSRQSDRAGESDSVSSHDGGGGRGGEGDGGWLCGECMHDCSYLHAARIIMPYMTCMYL